MLKRIPVTRLKIGLFVSLGDVPWFEHPFLRSHFLIKSKSEINDIIGIGRETVLYDPGKSKAKPLDNDMKVAAGAKPSSQSDNSKLKAKKASELRRRRLKFQKVEEGFHAALNKSRDLMQDVVTGKIQFCDQAKVIATNMAKTFLEDVELCVNHINASASDDGQHFHALNVMVLSLMLGQQMGLDQERMEKLAFGALVHDIGMRDLPKGMLAKPKMSKAEKERFQEHPRLGVNILSRMPDIDRDVMKIVYQHHEECDGTGYPKGVTAELISELTKIVCVADAYDRMINAREPSQGLSPHKALAVMYGRFKDCFDPNCLGTFIKMLGVYPPGTVCRFSTGDVGVIVSVDPENLLHPELVLFDPSIPKHDAIIYKLGEEFDAEIETTLRPTELEGEVFNYLNSRTNIQYFPSGGGA